GVDARATQPDYRLKVTGPIGSGELTKLMDEHDLCRDEGALKDLDVIVTYSTADYVRSPYKAGKPRHFRYGTGNLLYMIATDQAVADILVQELINRGLTASQNNIAIIAEWDTDYGRNMLPTFEQARVNNGLSADRYRFHEFSYLRGLDGRVPLADGESTK